MSVVDIILERPQIPVSVLHIPSKGDPIMPNEPVSSSHVSLIPPQPMPEGAREFSDRMRDLLDGTSKDEATVARALEGMDGMLDAIAGRLYSLASMMVGEGEDSVRLVEAAIATTDVSAC